MKNNKDIRFNSRKEVLSTGICNFKYQILTFLVLLVMIFPEIVLSQSEFPNSIAGPQGIYINCGEIIPKNFKYNIYRSDAGSENWTLVTTLRFNDNFQSFFDDLQLINSKNNIFELPDIKQKSRIWNWIESRSSIDSMPMIGTIPMYKEALGVSFYDIKIDLGKNYVYKVETIENNKIISVGQTKPTKIPGEINNNKVKNIYSTANENYISLRYSVDKNDFFHSVKVFRAVYLQSDFREIMPLTGYSMKNDSLFISVTDTNVDKKVMYQYYVIPYDMYGNPGLSSDTVRLMNMFNKAESFINTLRTHSLDSSNSIMLTWSLAEPKFMRSIDIFKSSEYSGTYDFVASVAPGDTCFIDKDVNPVKTYYYYVIINNAYGRSMPSARITGMLKANRKAIAPYEITSEIVDSLIKIRWKRPSQDTRCYYVFRSDNEDSTDFRQISGSVISDSLYVIFLDSLQNVKTNRFMYAVKSENTSYDVSKLSRIVYVYVSRQPAPVPMNLRAVSNDGKALITWDNDSTNYNIIAYNLYRKILKYGGNDSTEYVQINNNIENKSLNYFEDNDIVPGIKYEYTAETVVIGNKKSYKSAPALFSSQMFKPRSINDLFVKRSDDGSIILEWKKTNQINIIKYRIYRRQEGQLPILLKELNIDETTYTDASVKNQNSIFYCVTCVDANSIESNTEEWISD
jgi:fibronectin type 3 domain-containing protein